MKSNKNFWNQQARTCAKLAVAREQEALAWIGKGRQDLASDSRAEAENYRIAAAEYLRRARGKEVMARMWWCKSCWQVNPNRRETCEACGRKKPLTA